MKGTLIALSFIFFSLSVFPQNTATQSGVPAPITNTGEYARQIYEAAQAGHWKQAFNKLAPLSQSSSQIPPNLTMVGNKALQDQIRAAINELNTTVSVQDQVRSMTEANIINRDAAELASMFHHTVPLAVTYLDFYGRQLEIASITGDMPLLQQTAKQLAQAWQQLRPIVTQRGGTEQASKLDDVVQKIQSANDSSDYNKLAQNELQQVAQLKTLFEGQTATAN
jgi:hypothetical protein